MQLEQNRIRTLKHGNLNTQKGEIISMAIAAMKCDKVLKERWLKLFDEIESEEQKVAVMILYDKVIDKYFQMGAGQYIRDFKRDYNVTKSQAHRKSAREEGYPTKTNEKVINYLYMSMHVFVICKKGLIMIIIFNVKFIN